MNSLLDNIYKPDVLSCLSDLSSDEVFTPPNIANDMLDLLPKEIWSNPNIKILDPAVKSGVFLREAAKRFIEGEKDIYPNLQERIDHIMHEQIFGIACTELTALLSRRSLYCSKYPNGPYSISHFDQAEGNIRFKRINHSWEKDKCIYCGVSKDKFNRSDDLENHAYEFIHTFKVKEIFNMKFDVIISNPPYHLETKGAGRQAKPIYNMFIEQAKKLNPKYITMIVPSRWFAGGMGLDSFRDNMKNDAHISKIVDYTNAKDCFPGISLGGGVNYFLWDKSYNGLCSFTNITNGEISTETRSLNEFPVLVRYNRAIDLIRKILSRKEICLSEITSSLMPFGLSTDVRGSENPTPNNTLKLYASNGVSYISKDLISKGTNYIDKYKLLISKTGAEHAGEPSKDGKFRVIPSTMRVLKPGEVCTHSYFLIGDFENEDDANHLYNYMSTKFVRFLMLMSMSGIGLSKLVLNFVPIQNFHEDWCDEKLFKKYNLTNEEIKFIDEMIKPIISESGDE